MPTISKRKRYTPQYGGLYLPPSATGPDTTSGLVSYWPMFEGQGTTINDPVGGHNATGSLAPWGGAGFFFNGSIDVQAPTHTAFNIASTMTVMAWVRTVPSPGNQQAVVGRYDFLNPDRAWAILFLDDSTNHFYVVVSNDGQSLSTGLNKQYTGSVNVADGNLHSVCFRWNAGTLDLFNDGVKDTSVGKIKDSTFTTIHTPALPIAIGATIDSAGARYNGMVGNINTVKIYNSAKTDADILAIHNLGIGAEQDYIARTSGLDATHTTALRALIRGLVWPDGVFCNCDLLHIYANQTQANALLNLRQNRFNAVLNGSPTFTADRGFTGVAASSTVYIDTQFNASTASNIVYSTNQAHLSAWNLINAQSTALTGVTSPGTTFTDIVARDASNQAFFEVNTGGITAVASTDARGHWIANRPSGTATQGWLNGATKGAAGTDFGNTLPNGNFYALGRNLLGTGAVGANCQLAMVSYGIDVSSYENAFYNRLRTYMTVVGVP